MLCLELKDDSFIQVKEENEEQLKDFLGSKGEIHNIESPQNNLFFVELTGVNGEKITARKYDMLFKVNNHIYVMSCADFNTLVKRGRGCI